MLIKRKNLLNVWLSLTLSVLFFHPLFATLHDNVVILQWRIQHSMELIAVVVLFTVIFSGIFWLIDKISNDKIRFVLFLLVVVIPIVSFFVHFLQQLNFKSRLIMLGEYAYENRFLVTTIGTFCGVIFLLMIMRHSRKMTNALIILLLIMSPLNLFAGWTLWNLRELNTKSIISASALHEKNVRTLKHNMIVIIFDELSYEYLYKDFLINPKYANFRRLSLVSDNYHAAISPGKATLTAIPGLIMGVRYDNVLMKYNSIYSITNDDKEKYLNLDADNLFAVAKRNGYKTFAYGVYLPYCEIFGKYLDVGRSFSIYNYSTVETQFSLLNPIMTNFMIWPRQRPQGFIKNKVISLWQKKQTDIVHKLTMSTFDEEEPVFVFSHIYSTHVPFVFNRNGYYRNPEPFLQNSENYTRSLEYADYLLGELIDKMKINGVFDSAEIVILSDHNYRIMYPGKESHVPLIIKKSYQQRKKDIFGPVFTENILKNTMLEEGGGPQ